MITRGNYQPDFFPLFCSSSHCLSGAKYSSSAFAVDLAFAGEGFESVGPRLALAHLEHLVEFCAGFFRSKERAAIQRSFVSGLAAQRAIELEFQNVRKEVARVGNVGGDVILRARIEVFFRTRDRRRDTLVFQPQRPPGRVVIGGRDLAREYFPAPLVDQQAEWQEGHAIERLLQQLRDVVVAFRNVFSSSPTFCRYSGVIASAIASPIASWKPSFAPF